MFLHVLPKTVQKHNKRDGEQYHYHHYHRQYFGTTFIDGEQAGTKGSG